MYVIYHPQRGSSLLASFPRPRIYPQRKAGDGEGVSGVRLRTSGIRFSR